MGSWVLGKPISQGISCSQVLLHGLSQPPLPALIPHKAGLWGRGMSEPQLSGVGTTCGGKEEPPGEILGPNCVALWLPMACILPAGQHSVSSQELGTA